VWLIDFISHPNKREYSDFAKLSRHSLTCSRLLGNSFLPSLRRSKQIRQPMPCIKVKLRRPVLDHHTGPGFCSKTCLLDVIVGIDKSASARFSALMHNKSAASSQNNAIEQLK
jgi:hypothetical protein